MMRRIMPQKAASSAFTLAVTSVFTAFVCIATMMFSVYVPATRGFFNVGESMVFLSALLFGPAVGAFAGGVGSALADILLSYPYYAPATLIIKACEGYVVGFLMKNTPKFHSKRYWKVFTMLIGLVAGVLLAWAGTTYYAGEVELTLGFAYYAISIPAAFWLVLGAVLALGLAGLAAVGFGLEPEFGWTVFSVMCGGLVMVMGYFIYQLFFIGWLFSIQVIAIAELPVNVGQMMIGAAVALPAARIVWRAFPYLKQVAE
jgi:uncharacterized membrane protein